MNVESSIDTNTYYPKQITLGKYHGLQADLYTTVAIQR